MYILDIIPLRKGIPRDTLSYFSARQVPIGALVEIPLQSKTISGIVINQTDARDMKSSIRSGSFSLKQIGPVIAEKGFPSKILTTLQHISLETLIPVGTLLTTFFPDPIFEYFQKWKPLSGIKPEIRIIELPTNERFDYYKLLIRESFAKKQSIQFITPTVIENDKLIAFLQENNKEQKVLELSGSITPAKREKVYNQLESITEPVIICTTPQFSMIPRNDIGAFIIESSGSPYYTQDFRWNIDFRPILLQLAETLGYNRYLADSISSPEHIQLLTERKAFTERTRKTTPKASNKNIILIKKESMQDHTYVSHLLSSMTIEGIKHSLAHKEPVFIFSARKGVATTTTCRDCGFTVTCPNCTGIMQLIKRNPLSETDRVFLCGRCQTEIPPMNRCPDCLGWNLIPLGITTDALVTELKKFFPDAVIFESTSETTKTESACKKMIKSWKESCGIMVGTQKIIPYIDNVSMSIIASFEHCMSVPHFQTPFQTVWLMQQLYEKTNEHLLIQTKDTEHELLKAFKQQHLEPFFENDIKLRKQYNYPPYATLITIIMEKINRKDHQRAKEFLKTPIKNFDHSIQSQFFEHTQNYTITALVHIPVGDWKDPDFTEKSKLMAFLGTTREYSDITLETGLL